MPCLYVVPTPIGNLEDITLRALRVLREVGVVFAEDTRHTRKLLSHFEITTRLESYHQHTKRSRLGRVLGALQVADVALVSSAGMPSISDPGFEVVQAAYQAGIAVDVLPGPSAVTTAVVAAAIPAPGFLFLGFLPRQSSERRMRLASVGSLPYALVLFEAPHRLRATLRDVAEAVGDREIALVREWTKVHQEAQRGPVSTILAGLEERQPRGEYTLVVAGREDQVSEDPTGEAREELRARRAAGDEARRAVTETALKFGLSRNVVYQLWLESRGADDDAH